MSREIVEHDLKTRTTNKKVISLSSKTGVNVTKSISDYSNSTLIEADTLSTSIEEVASTLNDVISAVNATAITPTTFSVKCNNIASEKSIDVGQTLIIQRVVFMSFVDYSVDSKLAIMLDAGLDTQSIVAEVPISNLGTALATLNINILVTYDTTLRNISAVVNGNTNALANGLLTMTFYTD